MEGKIAKYGRQGGSHQIDRSGYTGVCNDGV